MHQVKVAEENLSSIENLKDEIIAGKEQEIFDNFSYIGCANKEVVLVQYKTSMYMLMCETVIESFVYQYILNNFAQIPPIEISNSNLCIKKILEIAFQNKNLGYNPEIYPPMDELINEYTEHLLSKASLLDEYFSITILDGILIKLPLVIDGHVRPDINNLPEFMLRLCTDVD